MDQALIKIGLPVKCRKCRKGGHVKPHDYDGWYKSKVLRMQSNKWFCPKHAKIGDKMDQHFYERSITPEPEPSVEDETEELYKLLD